MAIDFEKTMSAKSDESLLEYIKDRMRYIPPAVETAVAELQKRGHVFTDEELSNIRKDLKQRQEELDAEEKSIGWNNNSKIVTDLNAPTYYSEKAIYAFSIFFNALYGAIMLAINFKKTEAKKGILPVIFFGIIYTAFTIWMLSYFPKIIFAPFLFNCGGTIVLKFFFWNRYIGKDTNYRARLVWIPLFIGIFIRIAIVITMLNNDPGYLNRFR